MTRKKKKSNSVTDMAYVYKVYKRVKRNACGPEDQEVKIYSRKSTADKFIEKQDDPDMYYVTRWVPYRKSDGSIGYCLPLTYLTIKVPNVSPLAHGGWY